MAYIQQKPNKTTWQLWKKVIQNIYCNDGLSLKHDMKLYKWSSHIHTTQQHPYYYSPSCNEIFHHNRDEQYTRWMTDTTRQNITICTATQEQCDLLPSDCVPIQKNRNKVFKYFSQHNIKSSIKKKHSHSRRIHTTTTSTHSTLNSKLCTESQLCFPPRITKKQINDIHIN